MSDVYKTLYQGQLTAALNTLATVPASKWWIVKHISIVNTTNGAITFQLFKNGTAAVNAWTPDAMSVPAKGMTEWDGTEALAAAEYFAGIASVAASLTITISGDEVT